MAQRTSISEADEGKRVVNANGDSIGMISAVRSGTAFVDADPGLTDRLRARLGWDDVDADDYPLEASSIDVITDDEVRLNENV